MTYLEIVNKVLRRLRENEVSSVNETQYSRLIGDLVNEVKREVEDAWNWDALRTTLTASTAQSLFNYVLEGAGNRFRILNVVNDTEDTKVQYRDSEWFDRVFATQPVQEGAPLYYNLNGVDVDGNAQVDLYPIPDGVYTIYFNIVQPQPDLVNNGDVPLVDSQAIVYGTVARAIEERGDDGGLAAAEPRYRGYLADLIAIEAGRRPDETTWILR
jgi:hypothetical protein